MKVNIKINSNQDKLISELNDIILQIENELKNPICMDCCDCKDKRKGCLVGGGISESDLESEWTLKRNYNEHKQICKSTTNN